jgi:hypothetical protein
MQNQYHNIPFPIEEKSDGYWEVNIEGRIHSGLNEEDARLIAALPVELYNTFTDTPGSLDKERAGRIIKAYDAHGITCFAKRQLEARLKANDD